MLHSTGGSDVHAHLCTTEALSHTWKRLFYAVSIFFCRCLGFPSPTWPFLGPVPCHMQHGLYGKVPFLVVRCCHIDSNDNSCSRWHRKHIFTTRVALGRPVLTGYCRLVHGPAFCRTRSKNAPHVALSVLSLRTRHALPANSLGSAVCTRELRQHLGFLVKGTVSRLRTT